MESNDKLERLLRQMYVEEEDMDTSSIVDEEWAKFEAEHFGENEKLRKEENEKLRKEENEKMRSPISRSLRLSFSKYQKIAAMFVGVLMLSGIVYATVHLITRSSQTAEEEQTMQSVQPSTLHPQPSTPADSTQMNPVVFENSELCTILSEMAMFYEYDIVYRNEEVKHVRLYFTWNKTKPIDDVVETFNKFERFHINRENQQLIVE